MSGRNWTIYQLEILFHHHCSGERFARSTAPLYGSTLADLMSDGLLEYVDGIPRTTERGTMLVEMILQTPLPQRVWLDPRTGKEVTLEWSFGGLPEKPNGPSIAY